MKAGVAFGAAPITNLGPAPIDITLLLALALKHAGLFVLRRTAETVFRVTLAIIVTGGILNAGCTQPIKSIPATVGVCTTSD